MVRSLVRNLDEDVKKSLQRRAARHGRSMEEEARSILRAAADQNEEVPSGAGLGSRIAKRFAGLGLTNSDFELRGERGNVLHFDDLETG